MEYHISDQYLLACDPGARKRFSGSRIFDHFSRRLTRNLLFKALKILKARFSGSRIFDHISRRLTRKLQFKALKMLKARYVMLEIIIMTHNLPDFNNELQSE